MIRAVLFDLDGTLLDRRATFRDHIERQVERHPGLFSSGRANRYRDELLQLDENGTLDRAEFYSRAEVEFGLPRGASDVLAADFEERFPESCVALPNVHATLQALAAAGLKLGLVTNGRELIQRRKIVGLELERVFDTIVISEGVGVRKPDVRVFQYALEELDERPEHAVYVGDNPQPDIDGAKSAGLTAVWRRDDFWPEPNNADHIIDDIAQLVGWVERHR